MTTPDDDLDILKKRKDIEKLEIDIANAKASVGLERFKAWAALLGPVMTAVTILGTVYLGFLQISAKSQSEEDANWRQTINSIDEIKPENLGTRHVGTLLKPFLDSTRYRTLAIGVTIDELPKLRDTGTFKDLFSAAFPNADPKDLPTLVDLARRLSTIGSDLYDASQNTTEQIASAKRDERAIVYNESSLLCDPIAVILRENDYNSIIKYFSLNQSNTPKSPLDSIFFERCDFSDIDFSKISLRYSTFEGVILDGTILKNMDEYTDLWAGNIWWTASEIDTNLLKVLLAQFKPYMLPKEVPGYRDGAVIKQSDWEQNIRRLCQKAQMTCTDEQIRVDFPKSS